MSIEVVWDNPERTVIRYEVSGLWDWDEFDVVMAQRDAMMDSVDHPMCVIADIRENEGVPAGGWLPRAKKLIVAPHPRMGLRVVVGFNESVEAYWTAFRRVYPDFDLNFRVADTLEEARAMIAAWQQDEARRAAGVG